jgi:peroxiredoxin Q/BCP
MLEVGSQAPDFTLKNQRGEDVSLSSLKGKKVVLYFYPKDDTPGCTKEACSLRDNFPTITDTNTVVLGVSPDKEASHVKFIDKYSLPFDLLSDPDHGMMEAYDAWGEKNMYGKKSMGVKRSTFIIDEEGKSLRSLRR